MTKGYDIGGKYREDPIGADKPRGKDCSQRKHRNDGPSWTPSESRLKGELMRQFMRNPEGTAHRDMDAYLNSPAWCPDCNGRRLRSEDLDTCTPCMDARMERAYRRANEAFRRIYGATQ